MKTLGVLAACMVSAVLTAQEPPLGFPLGAPVRERVLVLDEQSNWTLRKGDATVVLAVVPTDDRIAVALAGGWLLMGADLDYTSSSFDLLSTPNLPGTPMAQAAGSAVVFVTGSPGDLAVLYPDTAVTFRTPLGLDGLGQIAVTNRGFLFAQGRRVSGKQHWNKELREEQPFPFFPSDLTAGPDGTPWAADSLQARPWHKEDDFWTPLEIPQVTGRMTSLSPFPDSSGYFASGAGWAGAFRADGTQLWLKDKDAAGHPLPRDLKVRAGNGKLLLWSALERQVWLWSWTAGGASGAVLPPLPDRVAQDVRAETKRLDALGSVPEALNAAQYGADLAASQLKTQPFSEPWKKAREEFTALRQGFKDKMVGAGVFTLTWEAPYGKPLATWEWEPDAEWTGVKAWRAEVIPYREGRAWDTEDFRLALTATRTPFPGAMAYTGSALQWPSWLNVRLRPEGTTDAVHWTRVAYPEPPQRYDLPTE